MLLSKKLTANGIGYVIVWFMVLFAMPRSLAHEYITAMPPLPQNRMAIYEHYKMRFMRDGYPGRMTDHGLVAHPLYGTYVINSYLSSYRTTRDRRFLAAAKKVADAALAKMDVFRGALAFYYKPEMRITRYSEKLYSGLTQSRYLNVLGNLYKATRNEKYIEAAASIFNSLIIPVEQGGVKKSFAGGSSLEEWPRPNDVPRYILNGWTTAMLKVLDYAERFGSGAARTLFDENLRGLEKILPLYDVPEVANSRYELAGFVWVRLIFEHTINGVIQRASVIIPKEGAFPIGDHSTHRYENFFKDGVLPTRGGVALRDRFITLNLVLCMISAPDPNRLVLSLWADKPTHVEIQIATGDYDPLESGLKAAGWITLSRIEVRLGLNELSVPIPWERARLVAYPTNFLKKIAGGYYNSYHFMHISNLRAIYDKTGSDIIRHYADKFENYTRIWSSMPEYSSADINLNPYGRKAKVVRTRMQRSND